MRSDLVVFSTPLLNDYLRFGQRRKDLSIKKFVSQFTVEEITPLEALKTCLEIKKVPSAQAKLLLEYGEKLIRGRRLTKRV